MEKGEKNKKRMVRAFSAGGVVYRKKGGKTEWLLIKPRGSNHWRLPKGTIDKGEKSSETAAREVEEETGVKARILEKLGSEKYFFQLDGEKIFKIVTFFLMEYEDGKAGTLDRFAHEVEKVEWVETEEALEKLTFKGEKEVLRRAQDII